MASLQGLFLKFKVIQIVIIYIRLKHCGVKMWTREKKSGAIFKVLEPWVGSYKSLFGGSGCGIPAGSLPEKQGYSNSY